MGRPSRWRDRIGLEGKARSGHRWRWWGAGIVATALVLAFAPLPPTLVESVYANGVYPLVRTGVIGLSALTEFVLFDVLLFGGGLGIVGWWTWGLLRVFRQRRVRGTVSLLGRTIVFAAGLYLVFLMTWGFNYRRVPLASRLGYTHTDVTPSVVTELAEVAVRQLNRLYDETQAAQWSQLEQLPERLGPSFERVQQRLGVVWPVAGLQPRRSLLTPYFRRAGIDGMFDPFSLQVLVNDSVLPFERPFTTAHEWAHAAGFAHEGEANFVAWLICLEGDATSQYSGWSFLVARLLTVVPSEVRDSVAGEIGPGPRADYAALRARLNRVVPFVQRGARRLNDRYLRANHVANGISSYGEVVRLAVGTELGRVQWPRGEP